MQPFYLRRCKTNPGIPPRRYYKGRISPRTEYDTSHSMLRRDVFIRYTGLDQPTNWTIKPRAYHSEWQSDNRFISSLTKMFCRTASHRFIASPLLFFIFINWIKNMWACKQWSIPRNIQIEYICHSIVLYRSCVIKRNRKRNRSRTSFVIIPRRRDVAIRHAIVKRCLRCTLLWCRWLTGMLRDYEAIKKRKTGEKRRNKQKFFAFHGSIYKNFWFLRSTMGKDTTEYTL